MRSMMVATPSRVVQTLKGALDEWRGRRLDDLDVAYVYLDALVLRVRQANRVVARAQNDRTISRADDLAQQAGLSVRSLHRLFERRVGVGPKWLIRRSRVQEAAERVARGERVDWAATAQELGYHDQSHLIRDFRAQVGVTPTVYARRCATAWRRSPTDARAQKAGARGPHSPPSR